MPHLFRHKPQCSRYYAWFQALHTRVDLLLIGPLDEAEFGAAEAAVRAELDAVERMGNRFDPDSELARAVRTATVAAGSNAAPNPSTAPGTAAAAGAAHLSSELFDLLSRCLRANRETEGLFDITVNSPAFRPGLIDAVHLTPDASNFGGTLSFSNLPRVTGEEREEMSAPIILDLSGILKGYALERLRRLLPAMGINDALVNLGNSSILSLGNNPSDIAPGHCLTTSGNATAARRHIRNPLTGTFVTGARTVSVTTADAVDGEIASIVEFLRSNS